MYSTYLSASISQNQPSRLVVAMNYGICHVNSLKCIAHRSLPANGVALLVNRSCSALFTRYSEIFNYLFLDTFFCNFMIL